MNLGLFCQELGEIDVKVVRRCVHILGCSEGRTLIDVMLQGVDFGNQFREFVFERENMALDLSCISRPRVRGWEGNFSSIFVAYASSFSDKDLLDPHVERYAGFH